MVIAIAVWSILGGMVDAGAQDNILTVHDGFDAPQLDPANWSTVQITPERFRMEDRIVRAGHGAIAIDVDPDDRACAGACQRNEIRIANHLRLPFGTGAWYGFSFQMRGSVMPEVLERWVIAQWKEESDGSPFLAQRYSGGVFHITVQDNDCRVLVARSGSTRAGFLDTLEARRFADFPFVTNVDDYLCDTDIHVEHGDHAILPDPYGKWVDMAYYVKGGREGDGHIEVWANGRFVARITGSIGNDSVDGPTQYFKFGIYRDPMPGRATLLFDAFRRGDSRSGVDPSLH